MKFSKLFNKLLTCDTTVNVYLVTDYIDNGFRANHVGTYVVGEEEAPEREICESSVVNICPVGHDELDVTIDDNSVNKILYYKQQFCGN